MSSIEMNVRGQTILVNDFNKVVKIVIDSPFQDPSIPMKERWGFKCVGFGISQEIVDILLKYNYRLFVHENESNKNFLMDNETLVEFLEANDVEYKVRDTILKVLPKSHFKEL